MCFGQFKERAFSTQIVWHGVFFLIFSSISPSRRFLPCLTLNNTSYSFTMSLLRLLFVSLNFHMPLA